MRKAAISGVVGTCLFVLLVLSGCGGAAPPLKADLELAQQGWDTLQVHLSLAERTVLGRYEPVDPDSLILHVFNAAYDTLYTGPQQTIPLPDRKLGDREPVLVEACLSRGAQTVCEQESVQASPKRIRVDHQLAFPVGAGFEQGSYDLNFTVERQVFGGDAWERIDAAGQVGAYLLAYVEDQEAEAVRVPLEGRRGRFDLAQYQNNRDFQYYLKSKLHDEREASVHFDLYAGLGGRAVRLASLEKRVRVKTREERAREVRFFVEQAVEQLMDRLHAFDRARVYVDQWRYDEFSYAYVVEMEVLGRSSFFRRFEMEGVLEVREDGSEPVFRFRDGNRRAEERWNDQVREGVLHLDPLQPLFDQEPEPPEAGPALTSTW